jgi:hypothetical protein
VSERIPLDSASNVSPAYTLTMLGDDEDGGGCKLLGIYTGVQLRRSAVGDAIREPVAVSIAIRGRNGDVR